MVTELTTEQLREMNLDPEIYCGHKSDENKYIKLENSTEEYPIGHYIVAIDFKEACKGYEETEIEIENYENYENT